MSSNIVIEAGEPRLAGTAIPVAAVVHACHEKTIGPGLAELAVPGLDVATIEPVLTYCAERRCEADDATCPGCRMRTQKLGIQSLDEFVARHAEIRVAERGHSPCSGRGTQSLLGREPGASRQDVGGRGVLVLGAPRDPQAAPWHPPRRPKRRSGDGGRRCAGRHPGAAATRRQHRHGGARHGQLRAGGLAPRRSARRLAEREGAHCRLRCQLHHRWRAGLRHARCRAYRAATGSARRPRASATSPSRC